MLNLFRVKFVNLPTGKNRPDKLIIAETFDDIIRDANLQGVRSISIDYWDIKIRSNRDDANNETK